MPDKPTDNPNRGSARNAVLRRALLCCDSFAFLAAWVLVAHHGSDLSVPRVTQLLIIVAAGILTAAVQNLYRTRVSTMRFAAISRLLLASVVSGAVAFGVAARVDGQRGLFRPFLGIMLAWTFATFGRSVFNFWLGKARSQGKYLRRVVLVGGGDDVADFCRFLELNPELGYLPVATVGDDDPRIGATWLGPVENAALAASMTGASGAIVLGSRLTMREISNVTRDLHDAGLHVHLSSGLLGINYRRVKAVPLGHEPFMYIEARNRSRRQTAVKRAFDLLVASIVLVVTSPVLLAAAVAIRLADGGPVFYRQVRIGRNGRPIRIHKLRTMSVDAHDRRDEVAHLNERTGPLFKATTDPRVTRVGEFLRASSLDELPQLIDVLRGDMSLVGPRPALPEEVAEFDEPLLARLRVPPGMTGLWQVEARDKPSFEAFRRLDLFYVENWSLALDFAILLDTIPAVGDSALRGVARAWRRHLASRTQGPGPAPLDLRDRPSRDEPRELEEVSGRARGPWIDE